MFPFFNFFLFLSAIFLLTMAAMSLAVSSKCSSVSKSLLNGTAYPSGFDYIRVPKPIDNKTSYPPGSDNMRENLLFHTNLSDFTRILEHYSREPPFNVYNWTSDGCSGPWASNTFTPCCDRHDFGYHNYKKAQHCTEEDREEVDRQFCRDMVSECQKMGWFGSKWACQAKSLVFYGAVRKWGGKWFCPS